MYNTISVRCHEWLNWLIIEYEKLVNKRLPKKKSEKLSERDLKELMKQRSYKRGTGGAIRQIR